MTTALELTREGWQPYLKGARRRLPSPLLATLLHSERERVLGLVRKAADVLKTHFGARRVILLVPWREQNRFTRTPMWTWLWKD